MYLPNMSNLYRKSKYLYSVLSLIACQTISVFLTFTTLAIITVMSYFEIISTTMFHFNFKYGSIQMFVISVFILLYSLWYVLILPITLNCSYKYIWFIYTNIFFRRMYFRRWFR